MPLDTYIPEVRHPLIGGKSVTVAPLKVRQIPPFLRAAGPAVSALFAGDLSDALKIHGEELIQAMAVATGEPADWLGGLEADEFLLLVGEVVEINADFFVHRVTPVLNVTAKKLTRALTLGATPLPSSSPADSDGPTAST